MSCTHGRSAPADDLPFAASGDAAPPAQPVRLILTAVATVLFLASLGQTVVSTALPVIVADLGGMEHVTWVITAYLLASTIGAPVFGKLGDMFGRKIVMQVGIAIFLTGSVVSGLAWNMWLIVLGRAVQGFGGGGLIVVAMALVADVLPARERGKVQGLLGAVFGISTVVGPLLGGFVVQQLNWHWIFFLNLPVGLVALLVLGVALRGSKKRQKRRVDYAGAALLAAFLSAAVLVSSIGGSIQPWSSVPVLTLIALGLVALAGFVLVEARAQEPILPLSLFANNNFLVVNAVGFLVGTAMFGAITFLPLFLQVVKGVSPATSGLFLLPMMAGLISTSALAGQWMTRTGRYKLLPILSTAVLAAGMLLLSTLSLATPLWQVACFMLVTGIGIGPVMSIGVAAVQNAVPVAMLGVATASANMFRLIGGSLGTAAFGAMFAAGLAGRMPRTLGAAARETGADGSVGLSMLDARAVAALPPGLRESVLDNFSQALHPVFLVAAGLGLLASFLSMLLRELPLSGTPLR